MSSFLSVVLVVPTRNPGNLWTQWLSAVRQQQPAVAGLVVDSASNDSTDFASLPQGFRLLQIAAEDFNHGGTRNLALKHLPPVTDVVVFMTQDALLADPRSLQALVSAFGDSSVACAYGRQLPHANATPLAAHARLFNYTDRSRTVTLEDRAALGFKACFISNSFAAYRVRDLLAVGGFPADVILGEDTTVAAKMLLAGKAVRYQADACVYHSHNYTLLEEFRRYFDTGVFHAREKWLLEAFGGASGEGLRFVTSELRYLLSKGPWLIPSALLRTVCKLAGYRLGRVEAKLPIRMKRHLSMFRGFWG